MGKIVEQQYLMPMAKTLYVSSIAIVLPFLATAYTQADFSSDAAERVHANAKRLRESLEGKDGPGAEVKRAFLDRVIQDYEDRALKKLNP